MTRVSIRSVAELLPDEAAFAAAYSALPGWRRRKCDRFRFDADKRRSVAAWLVLKCLCDEIGFDAAASEVIENENGKPFFTALGAPYFSLSHAEGMVMAAVADSQVGCDLERIVPVPDGVPERCLTAEELEFLVGCPDRERAFCRLWVRKESALKSLGTGLLKDPREYSVLADVATEDVIINDLNISDPSYCVAIATIPVVIYGKKKEKRLIHTNEG